MLFVLRSAERTLGGSHSNLQPHGGQYEPLFKGELLGLDGSAQFRHTRLRHRGKVCAVFLVCLLVWGGKGGGGGGDHSPPPPCFIYLFIFTLVFVVRECLCVICLVVQLFVENAAPV